jgi:hypothetical protein
MNFDLTEMFTSSSPLLHRARQACFCSVRLQRLLASAGWPGGAQRNSLALIPKKHGLYLCYSSKSWEKKVGFGAAG